MEEVTNSKFVSVPLKVSITPGKVHVMSVVKPLIKASLMSNSIFVSELTPTLGAQPKMIAKFTAVI